MTTPSYYVTIDSEFRDDQKYPFPTDFSVKFKDTTTGTQVLGVPTGPNIQDSFFTPLQIDPDYYSSNFRVTNGQVYNLKKLEDNTFLMCGVIQPLTGVDSFSIYNDTTNFVSLTGLGYYNSFLSNISFTNGAYQFNWIVYSQATGTNEINRCSFDVDINNNIYYLFDYTSAFNLNIVQSEALNPTNIYSVPNPTIQINSCLASFALTLDGSVYYTNGHAWGYHLITSNQDIKPTMSNGRSNINVDNALNLYMSSNINPYNPTVFYTAVATQTTGTASAGLGYNANTIYQYNGTTYFGGVRGTNPGGVGMWFDRYLFSPTGIYQISGDFAPYNQLDPGNQFQVQSNSQWFWVYGNTGYFIHGMSTYETRIVLSSVNLITGDVTWGLATVVGPITQAEEGVCPTCVLYGNYMYAFEPINYAYEYIQVYRVDLTNIAAGFTEVISQTTGYLWGSQPASRGIAYVLPVQCFLEGNNVYLSLVDNYSVISFLKFTINPSTYSITEDPINPRFNVFNNTLSGYNFQNHMFVMNGRRYTMISDTQSIQSALLDITDLNNIQKLSTLPGVKAPCQLYTSNNSYYIIDTSSYVYLINNPNNPLLVSSFFPQIDDTKNPSILQINNDIVIGIVISPSVNLWVTPFVSAPVTLNSIHYNLNIDASYNESSLATIQVVNLTNYPYLCELKGNRIYVKNISNIKNLQNVTNFNVFSATVPSTDPNNYRSDISLFTFNNCKTFTHVISGSYIYFFILFYDSFSRWYMHVVQTDLAFNFIKSGYQFIVTASTATYNWYVTGVVPYVQNGNIYGIVQYYNNPRNLYLYQYSPTTNTFTLKSSLSNLSSTFDPEVGSAASFNYLSFQSKSWYQTGGIVYTYENGDVFFFATLMQNLDFFMSSIPGFWIPINITNPTSPVVYNTYNAPALRLPGSVAYSNQMDIIKYSYNDIRIITHGTYDSNYSIGITNPTGSLPALGINGMRNGLDNYDYRPNIYPVWWGDLSGPLGLIYNANQQQYYAIQTNVGGGVGLTPEFTFTNITNINDISGQLRVPMVYGTRTWVLDIAYYGQKTYAVIMSINVTKPSFGTFSYSPNSYRIIDFTNPTYAVTYPPISGSIYPNATTTSYTGLNGIGLGFIHKLSNEGNPIWVNYIGSDGVDTKGLDINISNISIDSSLLNLYVSGGWKNKIECFNPTGTKANLITSPYTVNYNGFIAKIDLSNDGTFVWLLPSYGSDDIYFQRLNYSANKNSICFVGYFNAPIMQLYSVQTSRTSGFTNPITSQLVLSNTSISAGFLISINPSGNLLFSDKIFSDIPLRLVQIFDLAIDEASSSKSIKIVGISNTEELLSIDSTGLNTQITYSNINPATQRYLVIYSYDLNGIYQYSNRIEFPQNMNVDIQDIKSFSLNNRIVTFPNVFSTQLNNILVYNKDGTLATTINNYVTSKINCIIIQYQYNPTYTDVNGISYSKIVLQDTFNYTAESLVNYHLFIQGNLFDSYTGTITQIADNTTLNKNFSIRHNFIENSKDNLILNQIIDIKNIVRKNLSYQGIEWSGSISPSELPGIISYNNTIAPSNPIIITALYGLTSINTSATGYYLMYATGTELNYVTINSITYSAGAYQMNITNPSQALNQDLPPGIYYGPYIYFTETNQQAYYTLQFSPGTIYDKVYYNLKLNSLLIPNRRITSSFLPGTRSINDFRYIYLEVYNEDDNGNIDISVVNNYFTNNQNFVSLNQRTKTLFEIPIAGVSVNSDTNFVVLSTTSNIPILVISPGYYNLHMRLVDMYGNIINFDSTPNSAKASDSIFSGNVVDTSLMQIAANFTFTKITK